MEGLAALERVLAVVGGLASLAALLVTVIQYVRWRAWRRKLTWDDVLRVAEQVLDQIEQGTWKPDVVIGLGRSGGIWGGWLAGNLGSLPLAVVDISYDPSPSGMNVTFPGGADVLTSIRRSRGEHLKVLVVEGATSRGQTPQEFFRSFATELDGWDTRLGVLYKNPASTAVVDFVGSHDLEPWPQRFPWHARAVYRPHLRDLITPGKA